MHEGEGGRAGWRGGKGRGRGTCRRRALHRRDVTGAPEQSGGEATSGRAGKDGKEGKIEEIDKRRRGNGNTARDRAFHLVSPSPHATLTPDSSRITEECM